MVRRAAFTLIELIFAIVIIAISVISLPMMSQTISKGIDANMVQEAIFASATELNEAVTAHWDEASMDVGTTTSFARVINPGDCNSTQTSARYRLRPGHIAQPLHRGCLNDLTVVALNSNTDNNIDALDDMDMEDNITIGTSDADSYKETYTSDVVVDENASFGLTANNPNIKSIVSSVKDEDGNTIALLRTYSANIGEVDYYKRNY